MDKLKLYIAGGLFNSREKFFNFDLTTLLEKKYNLVLPQRDGFEFSQLTKALSAKLPTEEVNPAVQTIIYLLDMGLYLPKTNILVANLDDKISEGVVVEITTANLMGKPVIGFRTDARSPYGTLTDQLGGVHFFPAYQCDIFIRHSVSCRNIQERKDQLVSLASKINQAIESLKIAPSAQLPDYAKQNPAIVNALKGAHLLFSEIKDFHSEQGLEEIASRYQEHKKQLERIRPKITS